MHHRINHISYYGLKSDKVISIILIVVFFILFFQRFENTTETLREEMTKLRDTINQQNFQIRTKTAEIDRRNMMNEEKSRLLKESEMKREELHEMLTLVKSEYQK
eukprot:TRINITY_DN272061_c0_g1_i3.p1 TRINITY_DN272061_c0_g1~~TRINITY_DN272061_c0_g1_i3.p1  ORF type:complete len:105 (+),score=15.44 TRINITY_DN272061_c0_g1_i3:80-394(+)